MPEPTELSDADERVLRHLADTSADYPALVAANTGLHIPLVERRMATLAERGFVEVATAERLYRITEAGRRALDGGSPTPSGTPTSDETVADGGTAPDAD